MGAAMVKILVVDDDLEFRRVLEALLKNEGFQISLAANAQETIQQIEAETFDLVMTDVHLPDNDGTSLLRKIKELRPELACIVFSGEATIDLAVQAMRLGAVDFLQKPLRFKEVIRTVYRALEYRHLTLENRRLKEQLHRNSQTIIGAAGGLAAVMDIVDRIAGLKTPVLLTGESGVGKEIIANVIHQQSARQDKPLIKVNCGAIPETLIEAEFFGHERGAFTGAIASREGRFEAADGGTIFLDEIGEMPLQTQVKLLRALQEGTFERVGSTKTQKVDVRVIAATNKNLLDAIQQKTFREDLYFRLNVVEISIPPLRNRRQDLPALLEYFIGRYSKEFGRSIQGLSPTARNAVYAYGWPGNIRELENAIARGVALARSEWIELADLPTKLRDTTGQPQSPQNEMKQDENGRDIIQIPIGTSFEEIEHICIQRTLEAVGGHREKAAQLLNLSPATIYRKLKEWKVD